MTPLYPLPSLREQQQRLAMDQLMMSPRVQTVPPLQRRRISTADASNEASDKRKRGRPRKNVETAAVGKQTPCQSGGNSGARKSAYLVQKAVRDQLSDEVQQLEQLVDALRLRAGLPTKADVQQIVNTHRRNAELDEKFHSNRRHLVQAQSLAAEELHHPIVNPLATAIHLPRDMDGRRAILRGIQDVKLRRAMEVGVERFRYVDANSYLSEERFSTEDGTYHCNRLEMTEFPQFQSARQMYDALLFWMYNMEISVTEMVNQVAVREDDGDDIESTIWNHRIVTTTEDVGVTEELNCVYFAQFYDSCDLVDGAPLGVITIESVSHDDLYPYKPHERTRKELQSVHLFCEVVDPVTARKAIVFKTCLFNGQLPPQFPVESHVMDKLHGYMSRWVLLMNQYLSEYTLPS